MQIQRNLTDIKFGLEISQSSKSQHGTIGLVFSQESHMPNTMAYVKNKCFHGSLISFKHKEGLSNL